MPSAKILFVLGARNLSREWSSWTTWGLVGENTTREQIVNSYEEDDEHVLLVVGDEVVGVVYSLNRERNEVEVACN